VNIEEIKMMLTISLVAIRVITTKAIITG